MAATEYSADATLNTTKFASRALASAVTLQCLLWLCHWQADMRSKWRLASTPYKGAHLFGEALDTILVEGKDKKKVLSSLHRRADRRASPYYHQRLKFRSADSGSTSTQFQRPSYQGHERFPDRSSFRDGEMTGSDQAAISWVRRTLLSSWKMTIPPCLPLAATYNILQANGGRPQQMRGFCRQCDWASHWNSYPPPQTGLFVAKYL